MLQRYPFPKLFQPHLREIHIIVSQPLTPQQSLSTTWKQLLILTRMSPSSSCHVNILHPRQVESGSNHTIFHPSELDTRNLQTHHPPPPSFASPSPNSSKMDVPIAANVLGTIGAVCWSIQVSSSSPPPLLPSHPEANLWQLIPQIIINYRRHNTIGLQRSMMLLWACAGVPLGAYNIAGDFNVALQVQPQILTVLSLITWIQCYYYDDVCSPFHSFVP